MSKPFNKKSFSDRYGTMGDWAEAVYEEVRPFGKTVRFGWRRPKGVAMKYMPPIFRHMPDFYTDSGYLVEVMGLGKDSVLKSLKEEKWEALKVWQALARKAGTEIFFFIWNSYEEKYAALPYDKMKQLVAAARRKGMGEFDDGNKYFPIAWEDIIELAEWVGRWHSE